MDKNINDDDRIIIGVREWAIETVFTKGLEADRWYQHDKIPDTKAVCELASQLAEYVLGGIQGANSRLWWGEGKEIKSKGRPMVFP